MITLYGSFFFYYAIIAVIIPYLQVMVRNLGYSYGAVGALLSLYEAAGIVGPLVIALYIDHSGRMRRTVLFASALTVVAIALLVRSPSLIITIGALILLGLFHRPVMPAIDTYATNRFAGNSQAYSVVRAFGSAGFVALSLFFSFSGQPRLDSNWNIGLWAVAMVAVFSLFVFFWPKDIPPVPKPATPKGERRERWFDRAFILGMLFIVINRFVISALNSFFSLYLVEELGITDIGLMNAIASGGEIFMMILAGYLMERKRVLPIHLFAVSSLALALRYWIYTTNPSFGWVVVSQLLHSLCYGIFHPAVIYFIARRVKRHRRAFGMSIYASIGTGVPTVLGSIIGGVVIERYGYVTLFGSYGIIALLSVILALFLLPVMRTPPIEEG